MRSNISRNIRQNLKKRNISKNNRSCIDLIGYTIKELKMYLGSLFEPWMNWNNYGKYNKKTWEDHNQTTWTWQIDHIVPQSLFNFSDQTQIRDCWKLSNLRPLSSKQNLIKGSKNDIIG